jgi:hypothetical protein
VIIEHTFVTVRPETEAFAAAGNLMTLFKFAPRPDPAPSAREWSRGKRDARQAYGMTNLPQRLRIHFDRGRVSVAGAVELRHKNQLEARDTIVAMTVALEMLLAQGASPEAASADVLAKQAWIARVDRRRRIMLACLITLPFLLIIGAIIAASALR